LLIFEAMTSEAVFLYGACRKAKSCQMQFAMVLTHRSKLTGRTQQQLFFFLVTTFF